MQFRDIRYNGHDWSFWKTECKSHSFSHARRQEQPRRIGEDGNVVFTIGNVEIECAGKPVVDRSERRIATYLMFYGKWEYEAKPHVMNDEIEAMEHRCFPHEDHGQGFAIVGSMSELFCNFYKFATQEEEQVRNLRIDVSPDSLGKLIPID